MAYIDQSFSNLTTNGSDTTIGTLSKLPAIPSNAVLDSVVLYFNARRDGGHTNDSGKVSVVVSGNTITAKSGIRRNKDYSNISVTLTSYVTNNNGVLSYTDGTTSLSIRGYHDYYVFGQSDWTISSIYIRANYTIPTYTLTVTAGTGGTVTGGGTYNNQATATLTATPNSGYKFVKWSDGNTSATRTVTVTGNATYTATFEPITYNISFNSNGGVGSMNAVSATFNTAVTLPDCTFTRKEIVQLQYEEGNNQRTEVNLPFAGWMDYTGATDKYGTYYPYQEFDAPYYANTQADLYAAFGYDKFALVNHYVDHGKAEGRKCVSDTGVRGTYPNKATVKNLTTGGGGSASLYAAWGAASFTLPTPTREGYNFLHWVDDNGNTYSGNETVSVTSFISLTAVWEKSLPEIKNVQMIYLDKQISATNKVPCGEGFIISVELS